MPLTNPLWYLAALALCLGSVMAGVTVAAGAWDGVREARVTPITQPVETKGSTLAVYSDQIEDDVRYPCTTTPAEQPDADPRELETPAIDIRTDGDGRTWTLIAIDNRAKGTVAITCGRDDEKTDTNNYGYALVDDFSVGTGVWIALIGSVLAAGLAVGVGVQRHRAARNPE